MNKIISTIGFTVVITVLFIMVPNKSNIGKEFIIPILVAGIIKYSLGDWDERYVWTKIDILYWLSIIGISLITIYVYSKITRK